VCVDSADYLVSEGQWKPFTMPLTTQISKGKHCYHWTMIWIELNLAGTPGIGIVPDKP
jgi:hypothetical protein